MTDRPPQSTQEEGGLFPTLLPAIRNKVLASLSPSQRETVSELSAAIDPLQEVGINGDELPPQEPSGSSPSNTTSILLQRIQSLDDEECARNVNASTRSTRDVVVGHDHVVHDVPQEVVVQELITAFNGADCLAYRFLRVCEFGTGEAVDRMARTAFWRRGAIMARLGAVEGRKYFEECCSQKFVEDGISGGGAAHGWAAHGWAENPILRDPVLDELVARFWFPSTGAGVWMIREVGRIIHRGLDEDEDDGTRRLDEDEDDGTRTTFWSRIRGRGRRDEDVAEEEVFEDAREASEESDEAVVEDESDRPAREASGSAPAAPPPDDDEEEQEDDNLEKSAGAVAPSARGRPVKRRAGPQQEQAEKHDPPTATLNNTSPAVVVSRDGSPVEYLPAAAFLLGQTGPGLPQIFDPETGFTEAQIRRAYETECFRREFLAKACGAIGTVSILDFEGVGFFSAAWAVGFSESNSVLQRYGKIVAEVGLRSAVLERSSQLSGAFF